MKFRIVKIAIIFTLFLQISLTFQTKSSSLQNTANFKQENDTGCDIAMQDYYNYLLNNTSTLPVYRSKEFFYSGKNINDLGDYKGCIRIDDTSNYFIIRTTGRYFFQIGVCLPKKCDLEYTNNSKNDLLLLIKRQFNITLKNDSFSLVFPEIKLEQLKKENMGPMIVMMILTVIFLVLIVTSYILKTFRKSTKSFNIDNENLNRKEVLLDEKDQSKDQQEKVDLEKANKITLLNSDALSNLPTKKKESLLTTLVHCFNIFDNLDKIFGKNTNLDLVILDGVKFYSAYWVVLCHSFSFVITTGIKNSSDFMSIIKHPLGAFVMAGFYSVDSFFFMSGFLLILTLDREKKANFWNSFIFRLIRLYPFYIYVIFATMYFMPFLIDGPSVEPPIDYTKYCANYWWHNLLFINNLISYAEPNNCAGHTWYLANDMQFFLITIFIYFAIFKTNRKLGNIIFFCLFWISNILQFIIIYIENISHMNLLDISGNIEKADEAFNSDGNQNIWFYKYYQVPWCRISTYIIGLYFAQLYINLKDNFTENQEGYSVILKEEKEGEKFKDDFLTKINMFLINSRISYVICFIGLFFMFAAVFLFYPYNNNIVNWSKTANALFMIFGKVFFVIGLGILLHLTYIGKFRIIKTILSFHIYTPLSRLSYGIYLIHIYVIFIFLNGYQSAFFVTFLDLFTLSIAFFVCSAIASLVFSLMLDAPMIGIMKATVRKPAKPKAPNTDKINSKMLEEKK